MRYMLLICSDDKTAPSPPPRRDDRHRPGPHALRGRSARGRQDGRGRAPAPRRRGQPRARQGRAAPGHGRPLHRDQGGPGRLLPDRVRHQAGRPGGLRAGARPLARRRNPGSPRGLDPHHGPSARARSPAPRARSPAPRAAGGGARLRGGARGPRWDRRGERSRRDSRRPPAVDLHLLPSGPARRQPGGPHASARGRPHHGRDRAGLPRVRAHDLPAARAREANHPRSRAPLRGPSGGRAVRAAAGRARRRLPDLRPFGTCSRTGRS